MHGQNDQLRLLRPDQQSPRLDRFADETVGPLLARYRKHRDDMVDRADRTDRTHRAAAGNSRRKPTDSTFALNEIDARAPNPG